MKKLLIGLVLLAITGTASAGLITTLLLNTSVVGAGTSVNYSSLSSGFPLPNRWFQATLNGASAVSATVRVEGSTDDINWVPMVTLTLPASGTSAMTDAVATVNTAPYVRGNLVAISGVGASVTLRSGE